MYAALLNHHLVLAVTEAQAVLQGQKKLNQEAYYCPHCQKKVILVICQEKAAFFKHLTHYQPLMGEKEEHHLAKMLFKSAFTAAGFAADTEVPLAKGQLRADVLVSPRLAVEVQCAPLSYQEFQHRHDLYRQIRILDLWIVGHRHYLHRKLREQQLIFFRENERWGTYYLEVVPDHHLFRLRYQVKQEPLTRNLCFQTASFSLDERGIEAFWHFRPHLRPYFLNESRQRAYLHHQIKQKSKWGLQVAEKLYYLHLRPVDLPAYLFTIWRKPGQPDNLTAFLQNKKPFTGLN